MKCVTYPIAKLLYIWWLRFCFWLQNMKHHPPSDVSTQFIIKLSKFLFCSFVSFSSISFIVERRCKPVSVLTSSTSCPPSSPGPSPPAVCHFPGAQTIVAKRLKNARWLGLCLISLCRVTPRVLSCHLPITTLRLVPFENNAGILWRGGMIRQWKGNPFNRTRFILLNNTDLDLKQNNIIESFYEQGYSALYLLNLLFLCLLNGKYSFFLIKPKNTLRW